MTDRHETRKFIKIIIISIVLICFLGYTGYEIKKVVLGPKIEIISPTNGSLVSNSFTEISGIATNVKDITLNDRKIFIDEKGNFKEHLLLSYGYNTIVIKAVDKFGKSAEKIIEVIYK